MCDLPFRAWWEKERCQHKYPSWIHGGHGAAMVAMNLHPLSQAEKQSPSAWLKTMPSPANATPTPTHTHAPPHTHTFLHKQTKLSVYCSFLICLLIFIPTLAGRLACQPVDLQRITHKTGQYLANSASVPTLTNINKLTLVLYVLIWRFPNRNNLHISA